MRPIIPEHTMFSDLVEAGVIISATDAGTADLPISCVIVGGSEKLVLSSPRRREGGELSERLSRADLAEFDAIYLSADLALASFPDLSPLSGVRAFYDLKPYQKGDVCPLPGTLMASADDATAYCQVPTIGEAVEWFRSRRNQLTIIRTAEGAIFLTGGGAVEVVANHPIKPVSRLGAGDAFAAGHIFGALAGTSLPESVRCGAALAAHVMNLPGARPTRFSARTGLGRP